MMGSSNCPSPNNCRRFAPSARPSELRPNWVVSQISLCKMMIAFLLFRLLARCFDHRTASDDCRTRCIGRSSTLAKEQKDEEQQKIWNEFARIRTVRTSSANFCELKEISELQKTFSDGKNLRDRISDDSPHLIFRRQRHFFRIFFKRKSA